MHSLIPCSRCSRHVRRDEPRCPFCDARTGFAPPPELRPPATRLSRAALLAFAATSLGGAGCDRDTPGTSAPRVPSVASGSTARAASSGPIRPEDFANMAMVYGAPPPPSPASSVAPSPAPRAGATIGNVDATGVPNAPRVVAGMRAGFRACYVRALGAEPGLEGSLHVTITVGKEGEVLGAKATPAKAPMPAVTSCVEMRARAAKFDPPEGGKGTVSFPVVFTRQ